MWILKYLKKIQKYTLYTIYKFYKKMIEFKQNNLS